MLGVTAEERLELVAAWARVVFICARVTMRHDPDAARRREALADAREAASRLEAALVEVVG